MARKFKVAKLEDVPEVDRPLYVQKNGAFYLDVEGAVDEEIFRTAESQRGQFAKEAQKFALLISKAKEAGVDVEDDEALQAFAKAREKELAKQTDLDKTVAELKTTKKTLEKAIEDGNRYKSLAYGLKISTDAGEELRKVHGNARVIMPHIERNARVVEDANGRLDIEVVDPKTGQARLGQNQERFTLANLVAELKVDPDFSHNFTAPHSSGGDAPPGGHAQGRTGVPDMTGWSPEQKLSWAHRNPAEAQRLKAASAAQP